MTLDDYDYALPPELIAQYPAPERDLSRLMVVDRSSGRVEHRSFRDIGAYLRLPDVLVVNRTRVIPARLHGRCVQGGSQIELLLIREEGWLWLALGRPGRRLRPAVELALDEGALRARVVERTAEGRLWVRFEGEDVAERLEVAGEVPLPPYIRRSPEPADRDRYQTVYAEERGAIAAPTAGLHFTGELLEGLVRRGIRVASVLLHVGPGTFEPVRCQDPREHRLEPEYCVVGQDTAALLAACRAQGGRAVAVGTTVVRALETAAADDGQVRAWSGWSGKFILPPYEFRAVDALVTNFHLPRSSLLMLVAAFAGRELALDAYRRAVEAEYRFYSYGDAMLIL